jgi:hypothetical protein
LSIESETEKAISSLLPELYGDLAKPSAKRIGHALEIIFKVGLSPMALLDWGYDNSKEWLAERVRSRLAATPKQFHAAPTQSITYLALTHIAANYDQPELRTLFAELLLKSLDKRLAPLIHPAYFPTLAQLMPSEALIFVGIPRLSEERAERRQGDSVFVEVRHYQGSDDPTIEMQFSDHCASIGLGDRINHAIWLDNLQRLSLLQIDRISDINFVPQEGHGSRPSRVDSSDHRYLSITDFGRGFLDATRPPPPEAPLNAAQS